MADKSTMIEVKNLTKSFRLPHHKITSIKSIFTNFSTIKNRSYETQQALNGVSFKVKKGEFFGVVGRNGSGKSTLMRLMAGIYQPTSGSVDIHGKIVPFIELGVGFNPDLTGRENVYLNGAMLGFTEKEVAEKYKKIVSFAELDRFMDQKLKNYSSGMQVRLAFSVSTILAESDVLLLDEVLAVGDADFQRKCFDYFRQLRKQKKTVVFISHDMDAIRQYCDNAVLIDQGVVAFAGTAQEVAKEYTRLFTAVDKEEAESKIKQGAKRFGDSQYVVDGVILNKPAYRRPEDDEIELNATVISKSATSITINVGFLIKNASGEPVFGTNSHIEGVQVKPLAMGKKAKVKWRIPNILGDGRYTVDVAVTSLDGTLTHDWWEECIEFSVFKEVSTPYAVSPRVPTEVIYKQ